MGRAIIVASGKGGAGRTFFAVNLASVLAKQGKNCCVLDLNIGLRNADIYMGLQDQVMFDLGDIMTGLCKVERALVPSLKIPNLYLVASTQNKLINDLGKGHIRALVDSLKTRFDYVIIDGPSGVGKDLDVAACGADGAVIVVTPDFVDIRSGEAVDKRLQNLGVKSRCYVINKLLQEQLNVPGVPQLEDFKQTFKLPMAGIIPFDFNIHISNNIGSPIALAEGSYIAQNFSEIVTRMLG